MSERDFVDVTLLGHDYRLACPPDGREQVLAAVHYVDEKMSEIHDRAPNAGPERIAVMVALNLADELLSMRLPGGFDIGAIRRRMADMEARLDEALASQDSLF